PLSFDRVHAGHVAVSSFPLFQIPIELFPHVLNHLSTDDLLAFSQVDRDCRRLALLSIFKDVSMCFARDSICHKLLENVPFSTTTDHCPHSPSSYIAPCIRRLTVTVEPCDKLIPNYDIVVSEYDSLALAKMNFFLHSFVESVSHKIQSSYPNIHVLDWNTPTLISASTFNSILASPIKHLRLQGAAIYNDGSFSPSTGELFLETFSLDLSSIHSVDRHHPNVFKDILLRTSATLRQLIWCGYLNDNEINLNDDIYSFPRLRSLTLDIVSSVSDKLIQVLLGPSTRVETLAIDTMTSSTRKFFAARGYVPALKQLCWLNHSQGDLSPYDDVLSFLRYNTQLEALHIPGPASPQFLSFSLLPTLRQHFEALSSLHLVWGAPDIHEDALIVISTIPTLRHLWLSAGNQNSLRNTWEINHQSILTWLSPLRHLETFALSHDTYKVNAHPLAPRSCDYYASRAIPVALDVSKYLSAPDFDQIEMRRLAWESWHAERMLMITNEYVVRFPILRWLFIG
ncbi:hypothetical protein BJ912DRAFT_819019, partial [Pholiota molesta]